MVNVKNKIIFSFVCLIFYTALSLSFYLIPFNSEVLSIIAIFCTTIFGVFFILPAFLYSPIYSIAIGILYNILFILFNLIRTFIILGHISVNVLSFMMIQNFFSFTINTVGFILICLTIYFIKNYIKKKGTDFNIITAFITSLIIAFIRFVIDGLTFSSLFFNYIINGIPINNDIIIQQIISYVISVVCTFMAVIISYFIYMKVKDKPFFANNLNNDVNNE